MANESLDQLEKIITSVAKRMQLLIEENLDLQKRLKAVGERVEELRRENQDKDRVLERMNLERSKIRSRVDRIQENLRVLETSK